MNGVACASDPRRVGPGCSASIALTLIELRKRTPHETQGLSSMAHAVGYALASLSPVLVGAVGDLTGSWIGPLGLLVALTAAMAVIWLWAGRLAYTRAAGTTSRAA